MPKPDRSPVAATANRSRPGGAVRPRRGGAVRPATIADLDAVAFIENEGFANPWTREYYAAELENDRCHFFVAVAPAAAGAPAGPVVGYLLFWRLATELELHKIAVAPAWQRQGHAARLMEFFIGMGRGQGCERALLEVRAGNAAAIGLYERYGFRCLGRRKDYYERPREDALVFELRF